MSYQGIDTDSPALQLKGTHFGIRILFPEELPEDILIEKFEAIPKETYVLPLGTGVALDFQSRACSEEMIAQILRRVIWPREIKILAWISSDEETRALLDRGGFKTAEPENRTEHGVPTLILDHTLRSGQHEEAPGNVVLRGDLNYGAEIFAGGSVSVTGSLKGLVHAGCRDTEGVYVLAGSFEARQLRIGDKLCSELGPDIKWWQKPVIITLEENGLFFRGWKTDAGNDGI
ncbi:MAG: hypothetical protein LBR61_03055 [Synergistaceae bacterium]|jgi:septum site-determining protein MinC|nr:hypothetical protein [Synergistaceae bacterium]